MTQAPFHVYGPPWLLTNDFRVDNPSTNIDFTPSPIVAKVIFFLRF